MGLEKAPSLTHKWKETGRREASACASDLSFNPEIMTCAFPKNASLLDQEISKRSHFHRGGSRFWVA